MERGSRSVGVREGVTMEEEVEVMSLLALRMWGGGVIVKESR